MSPAKWIAMLLAAVLLSAGVPAGARSERG